MIYLAAPTNHSALKLITQILHKHREALASDHTTYHHHAQRVYHYAITLLLMRENKKLAIAAAFHDLDIWVSGTLDYLHGSGELARQYLNQSDFKYLPDEMNFIIQQHHQLTQIKGNIEAEAFRKADLIDLSGGHIRFNLPRSIISAAESQYPREGFSRMMMKKVCQGALKNPLNPLPMIKW